MKDLETENIMRMMLIVISQGPPTMEVVVGVINIIKMEV